MRRKQATAMIDEIRVLATEASGTAVRLTELLRKYGIPELEACPGEAHSNPHIDNCALCAPRWGWVGPVEKVS